MINSKQAREGSISIGNLSEVCKVSVHDLHWNIEYLKEKGYISFTPFYGKAFNSSLAKITSLGIDLVEDPNEFNQKFPIVEQNINITNSNVGPIQGSGNIIGNTYSGLQLFTYLQDLVEKKY